MASFRFPNIFFWRCTTAKPRTLGELKTAIPESIQGEETLVKVKVNFRNRLQICASENGHHLSAVGPIYVEHWGG